ncbi:baseplate J-like protein [Brevibacillus sp. AG162]|uniref:baseplate J/gp47 family protein n=1 Tax=Brevibacillus sp. AG162 TaxID=2572910 RepID=UPI0011502080|nr:baseplate J/gp47 family protein [Brevibacillus sp. AG162]TQK53838.1 baseplate J-like protein [Brevibacillus sp. AG162]
MATIRPPKPEMPLLRETPDQIYQRIVNRAAAYAQAKGEAPPATEEGEIFYDLWYPLAEEISEQQQIKEYGFLQAFVVWADGDFLIAHGYEEGVDIKEGEDEESYRQRILEKKRTEEGNGRCKDYESWALEIEGVGGAIAIEKERNDVSIDIYLTDLAGQPVTQDFADSVTGLLWDDKRMAGHDLKSHPAPIFAVKVSVKLLMLDDTKRTAAIELISNRIKNYLKGRNLIVYQQIGSFFFVDGVNDFTNYTLNDGTTNIIKPTNSVASLSLVVT